LKLGDEAVTASANIIKSVDDNLYSVIRGEQSVNDAALRVAANSLEQATKVEKAAITAHYKQMESSIDATLGLLSIVGIGSGPSGAAARSVARAAVSKNPTVGTVLQPQPQPRQVSVPQKVFSVLDKDGCPSFTKDEILPIEGRYKVRTGLEVKSACRNECCKNFGINSWARVGTGLFGSKEVLQYKCVSAYFYEGSGTKGVHDFSTMEDRFKDAVGRHNKQMVSNQCKMVSNLGGFSCQCSTYDQKVDFTQ